jgi:hypothetical protein
MKSLLLAGSSAKTGQQRDDTPKHRPSKPDAGMQDEMVSTHATVPGTSGGLLQILQGHQSVLHAFDGAPEYWALFRDMIQSLTMFLDPP